MPRCKKGFALLLTLAILSVMTALAVLAAHYVYSAKRKADDVSIRIEANTVYADIKKAFKRLGKTPSFRPNLYAAPLPLSQYGGHFSAMLQCAPLMDAVNINWLVFDGNQTYQAFADATMKVLDNLLLRYESENPEEFIGRLRTFVGAKERDEEHSIILQKYGTITYRQFAAFLETYEFTSGDTFVEKVPWRDIFVFEPLRKQAAPEKIAANYMKKDTVSLLYDIDPALVEELWQPGSKKLSTFLQEAGEEAVQSPILSDRAPRASFCRTTFRYREGSHTFTFVEKDTEVSRFVFEN